MLLVIFYCFINNIYISYNKTKITGINLLQGFRSFYCPPKRCFWTLTSVTFERQIKEIHKTSSNNCPRGSQRANLVTVSDPTKKLRHLQARLIGCTQLNYIATMWRNLVGEKPTLWFVHKLFQIDLPGP